MPNFLKNISYVNAPDRLIVIVIVIVRSGDLFYRQSGLTDVCFCQENK